jgi:phenylalanyl-tRNA synthetase beta chain
MKKTLPGLSTSTLCAAWFNAAVLALLEAIGAPVDKAQTTLDAPGYYHPGRSAVLRLGATVLAQFGEIHPAVLKGLDAKGPVVAFEVFLDAIPLPRSRTLTRPLLKPATFQPLNHDFAFIVDADVAAEKLLRAADKALIVDAHVFDIYVGKSVDDGKKSVALPLTLQPTQAALTNAQLQTVTDKVVANVAKQAGGVLRG